MSANFDLPIGSSQVFARTETELVFYTFMRESRFACSELSGKCEKIKEFSISENNTFSCHEMGLGINFDILNGATGQRTRTFGYLNSEGTGNTISQTQSHSDVCKRIKR